MSLDKFAESIISQLTRQADALEKIAAAGGLVTSQASTGKTDAPASETAAQKKKREAAEAAAAAAASKPKVDRPTLNAALVSVKDTIGKEAAQALFKAKGYEAMSKIEEKDFDELHAAATQELADFNAKTGKYAESGDDAGSDDL